MSGMIRSGDWLELNDSDAEPGGLAAGAVSALGRGFYVDQLTGSDANPGTREAPFPDGSSTRWPCCGPATRSA